MSSPSNDLCFEVRLSSIHDRGVFASRDLPAGTRIVEYLGEKVTKRESSRRGFDRLDEAGRTGGGAVYLFVLNRRYDIDGNFEWNAARLINHSCDPNCEARVIRGRIWVVALRPIPQGEELSFNYGFDLEQWTDHPCRCGSPRCAGYIVAEEYWPRLREMLGERDAVLREINGVAGGRIPSAADSAGLLPAVNESDRPPNPSHRSHADLTPPVRTPMLPPP